jgi:6-pyruvoyltetrahydropterin/6-carboxytetrahydropterin synthase
MYDLMIRGHFDAAHALHGYPGECAGLHGHTWDVEVVVRGSTLDDVGIVYDFKTLKDDLAVVLDPLDHAYLNDVPPFDAQNPTAENLSRHIYERLQDQVGEAVRVVEVAVWESPVAKITYRPAE